jgi:hypothetical protein
MFNVSIAINNATVSSKANSLEDIWELMVPALMAAGFDLEVQIIYSLHEYVERSGKFIVTEQKYFDEAGNNGYNAGMEAGASEAVYDSGYKAGWDARGEYEKPCS